ncbi:MAG: DNA repair protein RecN [Clostridiaceae bacterium]|jgi:DNA repair protein RecN (Recombination protein N)|nr:DNA repair protein RecN [Clostridiaceae bacterium]
MIIQLSVENVAIIEKLTIELEDGLNTLTGETGAGKSILIDAINALLGGRVSRDLIRIGEEKAKVESVFQIPPKLVDVFTGMGIDNLEDNTIILSRQFFASGKNICRINGSFATVSQLRAVGEYLIDIHGQNDNQSLLRNKAQIDYLDRYSGPALLSEKDEYKKALMKFNEVKKKIKNLKETEKERARLEDLYKYQLNEITSANLKENEDEELMRQSSLLSNAESIIEALNKSYTALSGEDGGLTSGAIESTQFAQAAMENICGYAPEFKEMSEALAEVSDKLVDISRSIRIMKEQVNYDPDLQQTVEERLALIESLKRKYGNTIKEIIKYGEDIKQKLDEVSDTESLLKKLEKEMAVLDGILYAKAKSIHNMRVKAACELNERITSELVDLDMPKAVFRLDIQFDENREYMENGLDTIEFLISPNPGEGFKPLAKIASGGEMSRIMLAIKTILADVDETGVLIFDEIDTGVSGRAALKVGEKLLEISRKHQVICVTHHAQIASLANAHYYIDKTFDVNRTLAHVKKLQGKEREIEISRLLSGDNSEITAKLAKEMIEKGKGLRGAHGKH